MRTWTKQAWAATTVLGFLASAANADEPAVVRISDRPMNIPVSGPMPATIVNHEVVVSDAACDGDCDGGGHRHKHVWPDHGFRRPVTAPINRDAVVYHRYWPRRWYGQPGWRLDGAGQFPMVYMPTDTTQLGFYYQRVPQWLPNPNMIPPAPRPSDWHRREVCGDGCNNGYGNGGAVQGPATPASNSAPQPVPTPVAPQRSPAPPAESASIDN